jgi:signal transduction histidine kinase/DNA-binding response OmpR family regulator
VPLSAPPVPDEDPDPKAAVLIVDDLPEKLLVFQTVLEELNQELVFVRSGSEALREVLHREFAVILLDVNMPDIDGFETASLIRKYRRSAHTPIIFVTAYADEMQTALGYSLGAVDYILSPVVPEVLRGKVKVFIDLHNMQRRVQRQSEQKAELAAAEAARRAAEEKTRRSQFLSQASRLLGGSLDIGIATRRLLELVVPQIASLATLVVQGETLETSQALCCEALPGGGVQTIELDFVALPQELQNVLGQAIQTRRRVDLRAGDLQPLRTDAARAPLTVGSVLPLVIGERALGALMIATEDDAREWSVLEELADRAAIAFENARLYRSLEGEIAERRQAQDKLQQLNQRKDEFLAMLSHELRNPLAPIRNSVEVIRRLAPAEPKLVRANEVMERQVRQMTRLVDELLDVARISQGKIGLQIEPVDLVAVIAHAVETVRPMLDARHHQLMQQLPDGAVWMRGDFARLSQVIANLLNNAAKYTEEGGEVGLSLAVEGGHALITVRDNGIGIDADLLPNVFDLFEQGKRALDRAQGGLGVGLTLVRRLVELHNGAIEASSAGPGQGAEFRVRLPCLASVALVETVPRQAVTAPVSAGCRVLVVDDNVDAAESVAMFLGMVGHEVKAVADGLQALACAPTYAPQVVVLDIGLPMLDGYEVAKRLRALPQTAHSLLVAVTGYGGKHDRTRADQVGFDRYLVKPADPCVLADMIASWRESADAVGVSPAGASAAKGRTARPG